MPSFILRKAPNKPKYWVVAKDTGRKFSKEPLSKGIAHLQQKALYRSYQK